MTPFETLVMEFARYGESKFNSPQLDWDHALFIQVGEPCKCSLEFPIYTLSRQKTKRIEDCVAENDQKIPSFECIDQFLASKSLCGIPWLTKFSTFLPKVMENCTTDQIKQHFDLYYNISIGEKVVITELQEFGCLKKNCEIDIWTAHEKMRAATRNTPGSNNNTFAWMEVREVKVNIFKTLITYFDLLSITIPLFEGYCTRRI